MKLFITRDCKVSMEGFWCEIICTRSERLLACGIVDTACEPRAIYHNWKETGKLIKTPR